MNITILVPKSEFTVDQQKRLASFGNITYTDSRDEIPIEELITLSKNADILGVDPANFGGWELVAKRLRDLMEQVPNLKALALDTTGFGHIDFVYCKERQIVVTNVPFYSTESVAEHTLAFILGCSKRIFLSDRRTQLGKYELVKGYEVKGKTMGVIGLGHIGTRIAELGIAIGMKVVGWNRTPKKVPGVEIKSIDDLLQESDIISISLADNEETKGFLSRDRIAKLKKGVIIVNTADRYLVDEAAMAEALQNGSVDSYAIEGEDLTSPPLGGVENAFLFKAFGWYTEEALINNKKIWIDNIEALVNGTPPPNVVRGPG